MSRTEEEGSEDPHSGRTEVYTNSKVCLGGKAAEEIGCQGGRKEEKSWGGPGSLDRSPGYSCLKDEHGSQQITGPPPAASVTLSLRPELALQLRVLPPRSLGQQLTE